MNEKTLAKVCLILVLISLFVLVASYKPDFEKKYIGEVKLGENGLFFGRVEYVIKAEPSTIFILNDGNKINVFSSKQVKIHKNDFVYVYGEVKEYNGSKEIFAFKVVIES